MSDAVKAEIVGDEIIIKVPIGILSHAVHVDGFKVQDGTKFAPYLVNAINEEDEAGNSHVHRLLDECAISAIEWGAEGIEENEDYA